MTVSEIEHVLVLSDDIDGDARVLLPRSWAQVGERPPLEFPGYWLYAGADAVPAHRRPRRLSDARGVARSRHLAPASGHRHRSTTSRSVADDYAEIGARLGG